MSNQGGCVEGGWTLSEYRKKKSFRMRGERVKSSSEHDYMLWSGSRAWFYPCRMHIISGPETCEDHKVWERGSKYMFSIVQIIAPSPWQTWQSWHSAEISHGARILLFLAPGHAMPVRYAVGINWDLEVINVVLPIWGPQNVGCSWRNSRTCPF